FGSQLLLSPVYPEDGLIFAGTVEDGVYRSGDRGATWEAWNIGLFDPQILCMAASPDLAHDRTLFVGTESGIFQSVNNGRFWRELSFAMDHAPVLSLAVSSQYGEDGTLYAGTEAHGLWRSSDRGESWRHVDGLDTTDPINAIIVDGNADELLVSLDATIMESSDGGSSWKVRAASPNEASFTAIAAPPGIDGALLAGLSDGRVIVVAHSRR
ncbi:MAG: GH74, partial [uncultured Chloroflexia bacterium]